MDELNGRMIACQLLITGLIARVANNSPDPLRFLTDFRDEIRAVVKGVNIAGMDNTDRVRLTAQQAIDELFSLMKAPSTSAGRRKSAAAHEGKLVRAAGCAFRQAQAQPAAAEVQKCHGGSRRDI
jgi:putative N-acetylmannosamine-6-phosphate epimerase